MGNLNLSEILTKLKAEFRIKTNDNIYQFCVSEKGNSLLNSILSDIRLIPFLQLQRNIIYLTFDSYKQELLFKEFIKENNDRIHFLINNFFKKNPDYSFNVYKLFYKYLFNGEKFEKISSFYLDELPELNFEKSGNIKGFFFKILIAFSYSEIKKTDRTSITFEELELFFENIFDLHFDRQIKYSKAYISNFESISDGCNFENKLISVLKELFVLIFLNIYYLQNLKSNEPIKNLTEQILNKDEIHIKFPLVSDNSIKSFVWKNKKISLRKFYDVLSENDLILSTSTYQKFKKCFDGSVVNEPYEFNTSEDKDIIYLIYLLRNDDYIERNGFYPVKKLIKVFKIKTDYESVKSIISSMVSKKETKVDSSGNQLVNVLEFNQTKVGRKRIVKINNIIKNLK